MTLAKAYPRTPEAGNPARTEAWALLEAARQIHLTKDGPIEDFRAALLSDAPSRPCAGCGLRWSL